MNALIRPLPERELLIEDQTAKLWDALKSGDLATLSQGIHRQTLRQRLRDELNDEPPEPRPSAYDEETGLPKRGPL